MWVSPQHPKLRCCLTHHLHPPHTIGPPLRPDITCRLHCLNSTLPHICPTSSHMDPSRRVGNADRDPSLASGDFKDVYILKYQCWYSCSKRRSRFSPVYHTKQTRVHRSYSATHALHLVTFYHLDQAARPDRSVIAIMSTYKFGSVEVIHQPTTRPSHAEPLPPSRTLLEPGHRRAENSRAIEVATILERDQILTMRDGVRLRADIYRPATGEAVPAIVMWGPYGKSGSGRCKQKLLRAARAALCEYLHMRE